MTSETYPTGTPPPTRSARTTSSPGSPTRTPPGPPWPGSATPSARTANSPPLTPRGSAISAPAQTYTYNPLSQLTGTGTASYGYDNAADPTTLGSTTQTFNAGGQLATATTSGTTTTYGYNARGDRISATTTSATTSYGYNEANQLTSYTPATGAATTYAYNGDGLLMSETTAGTTTSYAWDTQHLPLMLTAGTTSFIYGPGGLPVEAVTSAGDPHLLHARPARLHPAAHQLHRRGHRHLHLRPLGQHHQPHRHRHHTAPIRGPVPGPATGFYYLRNRYYDPATAQFLTIDPAVSQTQAPYTYTSDSPLNATDPEGLVTAPPPTGGGAPTTQNHLNATGSTGSGTGCGAGFNGMPSQSDFSQMVASIMLYRAVNYDEALQILANGAYELGPNGAEGKYFFTSEEQAQQYAEVANEMLSGSDPYVAISAGAASDSVVAGADTVGLSSVEGGEALFVGGDALGDIADVVIIALLF